MSDRAVGFYCSVSVFFSCAFLLRFFHWLKYCFMLYCIALRNQISGLCDITHISIMQCVYKISLNFIWMCWNEHYRKFSICDVSFCVWSNPIWCQMVEGLSVAQNKPEFKNAFHWSIFSVPDREHDCVTVNVCRHTNKGYSLLSWKGYIWIWLKRLSLMCLTIVTRSLVHNQAFQSVTAFCFIS